MRRHLGDRPARATQSRRRSHGRVSALRAPRASYSPPGMLLSARPPLHTNRTTTPTFRTAAARSAADTLNVPSSDTTWK